MSRCGPQTLRIRFGRCSVVLANEIAVDLGVRHQSTSLLVGGPVRSEQSVILPSGDVTVIGSVASGAEVMAGGSIHIYGTLLGR
jgi:septum site-determining protein MinC